MMVRSLLAIVFVIINFTSPAAAVVIDITPIDVDKGHFLISLDELGQADNRVYTIRMDSGAAGIIFGDGIFGAVPPDGQSNVVATYRHGAGGTEGKIINIYPLIQEQFPILIPFSDFIAEDKQEDVSFLLIALASIKFEFSTAGILVVESQPGVVPIPAAAWLFGSGLLGLVGIARRKKA